jgi:hypothetical protein
MPAIDAQRVAFQRLLAQEVKEAKAKQPAKENEGREI